MQLGRGLGVSCSDGIFNLGLGAGEDDDDNEEEDSDDSDEGLGLTVEAGLPAGSLETVPAMRPGLGLLWWSDEDLVLELEDELGLAAADDEAMLGLGGGLLVLLVVLGLAALPFSRRWLLYELRLGSLYRSTVRTFP